MQELFEAPYFCQEQKPEYYELAKVGRPPARPPPARMPTCPPAFRHPTQTLPPATCCLCCPCAPAGTGHEVLSAGVPVEVAEVEQMVGGGL